MRYEIKVRKSKSDSWKVVVAGIPCSAIQAGKLAYHFHRTYGYVKITELKYN